MCIISFARLTGDKYAQRQHCGDTSNANTLHDKTRSLSTIDLEAPDPGKELTVCDGAEDDGMYRKGKVVAAHGRLRRYRVANRILGLDGGAVEESSGRNGIRSKS
jgi:hypothetical protein